MQAVTISEHFGIIIRKDALVAHHIPRDILLATMEADTPLDENETLLSFGPHFGGEAVAEFTRRLEHLGLTYGEHFIDIAAILPDWLQLQAVLRTP